MKYDNEDRLIRKAIQYTDCPVGYYIEYFPNEKVKLIGHYKEYKNTNWDNLSDINYCKRDGTWTYFNETGNELYSEFWKDGEFIRQVPEQPKTELWDFGMLINGIETKQQTFTFEELKELTIVAKFKNKSYLGTNIKIRVDIRANGYKPIKKEFSLDNFHQLNISQLLTLVVASATDPV